MSIVQISGQASSGSDNVRIRHSFGVTILGIRWGAPPVFVFGGAIGDKTNSGLADQTNFRILTSSGAGEIKSWLSREQGWNAGRGGEGD